MSGEKLYIWQCSRCHQQRSRPEEYHWHETAQEYVPAEKVEVVPVDDYARLQARLDRLEAERDAYEEDRDKEAEAAAMWCCHSMAWATDCRAAQTRLEEVEGAHADLIERIERDRREPDKLLCHLASARRTLNLAAIDAASERGEG